MCHSVCKPSSSHKLLPSKGRYHDAADVACLPLLLLQQSGYCGRSLSGHLHGHDLSSSISVCYFGSNTFCVILEVTHHLASSCTTFNHIALSCIILHRLASPCIVLQCLTLSCIVLHCLAASCSVIAPCDKHSNSVTKTTYVKTHFWLNPTSVEGSKTFINELRSSATSSQALPDRVSTPPAVARTRSSSFRISSKERLSHSLPCETAPRRSSSNLAADASSTYGIRHTANTKPPSSYNIAPCDKHATFVTILVCHTGPALEVPRHPAIERAALQPQTTSCPVHGQHSEPVPFCEAPLQKFVPGHPGAIHDPWSQHCYAAPATEVPRHRTTRMTRSHAPFAQTFPSANETATTKRPQTSRVRDFNQTFCIQKFRDMHMCSLDFKTKLNGTKLNGTMIPVVFFVHCSCISMKTSHIFFLSYTSHRSTAS